MPPRKNECGCKKEECGCKKEDCGCKKEECGCKHEEEPECDTCCKKECDKCSFDGDKCFENCKNAKNPAGIKCGSKCKNEIKCLDCCEALSSDIENEAQRFDSKQRCKEGSGYKRAFCVEKGFCEPKPCLTCCQK